MKTFFDYRHNCWNTDTVRFLKKHDIVYGSPALGANSGLPLGDGECGSLVWFESEKLHIGLRRCDLWDDSTWEADGVFCSGEEENLTAIRQAGEITVDFGMPIFDQMFQSKFEERLSLQDATLQYRNETPFGRIQFRAFTESRNHTGWLHLTYEGEPISPRVALFRFGSRINWRWYNIQSGDVEKGTEGTITFSEGDRLYVIQKLHSTVFCVALSVKSENGGKTAAANSRKTEYTLSSSKQQDLTLTYTVVIGTDEAAARKKADRLLNEASDEGEESLYKQHLADWHTYWNTSYVRLSDDYIENICAFSAYILNASCRGEYAPHFTNSLWGHYYDYQPWVYYFHYNMQGQYHAVNALGHSALSDNYYAMRRRSLPNYIRYATEIKHKKGAFCHDVTDRYGRGATYDSDNATPLSQIALAMYQKYRFNGDESYLQNDVLPMLRGVGEYYADCLIKEDDGLYHLYGTSAYEGHKPTKDTLTDLVMLRAVLPLLVKHTTGEESETYAEILSHLPPYHYAELSSTEVDENGYLRGGIGKGTPARADRNVLTCGIKEDGSYLKVMQHNPALDEYGFPDIEMSPIFPAGILGLHDKGSFLYDAVCNSVLLHKSYHEACMEWCMMPLYLSRMGLAEYFLPVMREFLEVYQGFVNGFGAEANEVGCKTYFRPSGYFPKVKSTDTGKETTVSIAPYAHFDFETDPLVLAGCVEALFQSYDGVLRLFPAIVKDDIGGFLLYGAGGFTVQGEKNGDDFLATIDTEGRSECTVTLPYQFNGNLYAYLKRPDETDFVLTDVPRRKYDSEEVLSFGTLPVGTRLLLCSQPIENILVENEHPAIPNQACKQNGVCFLGTPPLVEGSH